MNIDLVCNSIDNTKIPLNNFSLSDLQKLEIRELMTYCKTCGRWRYIQRKCKKCTKNYSDVNKMLGKRLSEKEWDKICNEYPSNTMSKISREYNISRTSIKKQIDKRVAKVSKLESDKILLLKNNFNKVTKRDIEVFELAWEMCKNYYKIVIK